MRASFRIKPEGGAFFIMRRNALESLVLRVFTRL